MIFQLTILRTSLPHVVICLLLVLFTTVMPVVVVVVGALSRVVIVVLEAQPFCTKRLVPAVATASVPARRALAGAATVAATAVASATLTLNAATIAAALAVATAVPCRPFLLLASIAPPTIIFTISTPSLTAIIPTTVSFVTSPTIFLATPGTIPFVLIPAPPPIPTALVRMAPKTRVLALLTRIVGIVTSVSRRTIALASAWGVLRLLLLCGVGAATNTGIIARRTVVVAGSIALGRLGIRRLVRWRIPALCGRLGAVGRVLSVTSAIVAVIATARRASSITSTAIRVIAAIRRPRSIAPTAFVARAPLTGRVVHKPARIGSFFRPTAASVRLAPRGLSRVAGWRVRQKRQQL